MRSFVSYHLIDRAGEKLASFDNLKEARLGALRLRHIPFVAPITIHRVTSTVVERRYRTSATVYNPQDARTRFEKRSLVLARRPCLRRVFARVGAARGRHRLDVRGARSALLGV